MTPESEIVEIANPFAMNAAASAAPSALVSVDQQRAIAEVQAMVVSAKQYPRDEHAAFTRIINSCKRPSLAAVAEYRYRRGGSEVIGPSVRLAEVVAQNWGNMDFGITELEQRAGESVMLAYAWDIETNTRQARKFYVKHVRKTKNGSYALDDQRDIYEMTANLGARRMRACILSVIPPDVIGGAVAQCRRTITEGIEGNRDDHLRRIVMAFDDQFSVSNKMLEKYLGRPLNEASAEDIADLRAVFKTLKDGHAKRDEYFGANAGKDDGSPQSGLDLNGQAEEGAA